jgi:hypothetical protein
MTTIIAGPCIDIKDRSCVDVCPVDCIHEFGQAGALEERDLGPVETGLRGATSSWRPAVKIPANFGFPVSVQPLAGQARTGMGSPRMLALRTSVM